MGERANLIAFLDSLGRDEFDMNGDRMITLEDFATLVACQGASGITADDNCAIGDIDQNGVINATDLSGFLLAGARDGLDVSLDCDNDGTLDLVAIFNGVPDRNGDGVPDNCVVLKGSAAKDQRSIAHQILTEARRRDQSCQNKP